jgi:transcription elongation factor Elf1
VTKLKLISGTQAPDTLKERVRASLRKTKVKNTLQCPVCGGRSYIELKTGDLVQKICKFCDWDKRIVVME